MTSQCSEHQIRFDIQSGRIWLSMMQSSSSAPCILRLQSPDSALRLVGHYTFASAWHALRQVNLDGRGLSNETQYADGLEPRRPAPVPENTSRPRSMPAPGEVPGAGKAAGPLPASLSGLTAGTDRQRAGSGEGTVAAADVTRTYARSTSMKHNPASSQVRRPRLSL